MPPKKKRVLEGSDGPDGHMFYVDSDFLIHYGPGQRALCRMSVTHYTEIVEIGPGKVAKKPKEITKELVISRILSRVSKKMPRCPSFTAVARGSCDLAGGYRCGLVAFGHKIGAANRP